MKTTEKIFAGLLILGFTLDMIGVPGSTFLMLVGAGGLCCIYFYLGWALFNDINFKGLFKKNSYQEIKIWNILFPILTGIFLSAALLGFLFRFLIWPGAKAQLFFGLGGITIMLAVAFIGLNSRDTLIYKQAIYRIIPISLVALVILFVSDERLLTMHYSDHPDYLEAELESKKDPKNIELRIKANEEFEKMFEEEEFNERINE